MLVAAALLIQAGATQAVEADTVDAGPGSVHLEAGCSTMVCGRDWTHCHRLICDPVSQSGSSNVYCWTAHGALFDPHTFGGGSVSLDGIIPPALGGGIIYASLTGIQGNSVTV